MEKPIRFEDFKTKNDYFLNIIDQILGLIVPSRESTMPLFEWN